jgi:hypothetical protein
MLSTIIISSVFAVVSVAGIAATGRAVSTDGYHRVPTRRYLSH